MKKLFLFFTLAIPLVLFFEFFRINQVSAQGSCTCIVGTNMLCDNQQNNCDTGYAAVCIGNITQCNGNSSSCDCINPLPSINPTLSITPTPGVCGETGQPCCSGICTSGLTCVNTAAGDYCLDTEQSCCLPGGPPTGVDCTGVICSVGGNGTAGGGPAITGCNGGQGFQTAIGCIPVESPQAFAEFFIKWAMGIAGGIALALIGYSGFMIISSAGNPQKLQAGKELLTSAIMGLTLILFGVFALRFIGVDILHIPGFGV